VWLEFILVIINKIPTAPELVQLTLEGVCCTSRDDRFWQNVPSIYYSCTEEIHNLRGVGDKDGLIIFRCQRLSSRQDQIWSEITCSKMYFPGEGLPVFGSPSTTF